MSILNSIKNQNQCKQNILADKVFCVGNMQHYQLKTLRDIVITAHISKFPHPPAPQIPKLWNLWCRLRKN